MAIPASIAQISQVIDQLPGDIKKLWPQSARTFRERL